MIKILIDFQDRHSADLGRPGGMRWPPGGIIGGSKNTLFEDLQVSKADLDLRVEIWHVDWALGDGSGTLGSAPPQAPGAGGGLTSPRGITAARPPFSFCNLWRGLWDSSISAMLAVLNVLGQLLGPSQGVLLPLGAVLGASWDLLGHSWGPLGASWGALGGVLGPLGVLLGRLGGDRK